MTAILVVGPAWVGDMVMAQTLFAMLRKRSGDVRIDVLAPGWSRPLLQRMPEVRRAIDMPVGHGELGLRRRFRIGRALRAERYDQAIVLPNSWKSALIPWWARVPLRTGYVGEMRRGLLNDARRLDREVLPGMVQRLAALGVPAGGESPGSLPRPALKISGRNIDLALGRLGLARPVQPVLALCPGAQFGPAKRWPAEYFAEVARTLSAEGWQVWLFGSAADAPVAGRVAAAVSGCIDLTGRTSLAEAVDLLSLATVVVCNDSGLMHVAAALDRDLVALFGSSDPAFTPPLHPDARVLHLGLGCSPCFARECPLGHLDCLRGIEPGRVIEAIEAFASRPRRDAAKQVIHRPEPS